MYVLEGTVWSLSARRAWIEIGMSCRCSSLLHKSLSARRAWIEIPGPKVTTPERYVALRKESVDRNQCFAISAHCLNVALRKESVDRNIGVGTTRDSRGVALRKESVDRNQNILCNMHKSPKSLSARRAWIEIQVLSRCPGCPAGRSPQGERG